jgi:hypothetical protein
MLFLAAQYWVFVLLAVVAGIAVGWFAASPAGRARAHSRRAPRRRSS